MTMMIVYGWGILKALVIIAVIILIIMKIMIITVIIIIINIMIHHNMRMESSDSVDFLFSIVTQNWLLVCALAHY